MKPLALIIFMTFQAAIADPPDKVDVIRYQEIMPGVTWNDLLNEVAGVYGCD